MLLFLSLNVKYLLSKGEYTCKLRINLNQSKPFTHCKLFRHRNSQTIVWGIPSRRDHTQERGVGGWMWKEVKEIEGDAILPTDDRSAKLTGLV